MTVDDFVPHSPSHTVNELHGCGWGSECGFGSGYCTGYGRGNSWGDGFGIGSGYGRDDEVGFGSGFSNWSGGH